ncbi:unnamed protein product, partial [Iphiclides podalirius]
MAWAPFMVLISWINAFDDTERDKTYLKIGFDFAPNSNGNPSLRIRRYAAGDIHKKDVVSKPSIRADSISDSDEKDKSRSNSHSNKKVEPIIPPSNEEESSNESNRKEVRSTKGLRANEYEPEANPKIHGRSMEMDSESDE